MFHLQSASEIGGEMGLVADQKRLANLFARSLPCLSTSPIPCSFAVGYSALVRDHFGMFQIARRILPMRRVLSFWFRPVAFAVVLVSGSVWGSACTAGDDPVQAANALEVSAKQSVVTVGLTPFSLSWRGENRVRPQTRSPTDCSPISIALRPDDDPGGTFFSPESPANTLIWARAKNATVVSERPLTLAVDLEDAAGRFPGVATVVLAPSLGQGRQAQSDFIQVTVTTDYRPRAVALIETCFAMPEGEHAVGGGERFNGVDLGGKVTPLFFQAPGRYASSTNEAHAPVPFIATEQGLGVFFETERVGAFDLSGPDLRARFAGNALTLKVSIAPILDNVAAYARLRGPSALPPLWALAPMQWRNEVNVGFDAAGDVAVTGQDQVMEDAAMLRSLQIPTSALWIDAPWETGLNTFDFNPMQFPDPDTMLANLDLQGFRVMVWATENLNRSDDSGQQPGMPPFASLSVHDTFAENGWLVGSANGPFHFRWPRGDGAFVDFTNPDAVAAWRALIRPLLLRGIRGFKLDYGETMRADIVGAVQNDLVTFSDGSTAAVQHTRYSRLYHQAFLDELNAVWPQDSFVITRTGGIYDQINGTAIWPGDLDSDLSHAGDDVADGLAVGGLPAALSGALSLSMSGYPLYGSDIGGFRGPRPTSETLLRWAQFASLGTVMQLGGGAHTHNPWEEDANGNRVYGDEATDIYRRYARLHTDLWPTLLPLITDLDVAGGAPLIPAGVVLGTAEAWADPDAFFLGQNIYAAPVVQSALERDVVVPGGAWLDWWTGEELTGPSSINVSAPLDTLPLYFRAGAVVVLGDSRLMTLVDDAGPDVADLNAYGDVRVLRTSAGSASQTPLAQQARTDTDYGVVTQQTDGDGVTLTVTSTEALRYQVELFLREGIGPNTQAAVAMNDIAAVEVTSQEALRDCADLCVWRQPSKISVMGQGRNVVFSFGAP